MSKSRPDKDSKKPAAPEKEAPSDGGWRETIESIAMAVILALLFRGFVAEAFVIPTGSMAPTLQGRHKDVWCPKCNKQYQVSCSLEQDQKTSRPSGQHVVYGTCPICQYTQALDPLEKPNDGSFSGDRIIVGKFCYDLGEPQRWDVIVFKFPHQATQNYIKRLVGLPEERLRIVGGNVYVCGLRQSDEELQIARKPPRKLQAMLQLVDDTNHIPQELIDLGWPSRWQAWPAGASAWKTTDGGRSFVSSDQSQLESWLRYRHLVPTSADWHEIDGSKSLPAGVAQRPGQLIADYYAYNTVPPDELAWSSPSAPFSQSLLTPSYSPPQYLPDEPGYGNPPPAASLGLHWVDDLAVECLADVTSSQGELSLMLVRGGAKYVCSINLANGKATMSIVDYNGDELSFGTDINALVARPTAQTSVKGPGGYRLRLSNCDHELLLWVNGSVAKFDAPTTYLSDPLIAPYFSAADPGDLAPAGIGTKGAAATISDVRIFRDKYYIATRGGGYLAVDYGSGVDPDRVRRVFADPALWENSGLFGEVDRRYEDFILEKDQFLPLGDNSPQSYDGRFWFNENYVERDLLIGKALLIYWPHTWNRPIPFFPNFRKMGPIR
jgi:signal peptidase I